MQSPLLGEDALPAEVTIGGRAFPIRHDFRDGVRFETLMFAGAIPETAKVPLALDIWFDERPDADLGEVIAAMLTFYRCGKPEAPESGDSSEQLYDYAYDYDLIFSAFLNCYGIDLLEPSLRLHWWKFRAMLAALPEDTALMRVIGYRAAKITPEMSKEYRAHLRKMKRIHALPREATTGAVRIRSEAEHDAALAAVLAAKRGEVL